MPSLIYLARQAPPQLSVKDLKWNQSNNGIGLKNKSQRPIAVRHWLWLDRVPKCLPTTNPCKKSFLGTHALIGGCWICSRRSRSKSFSWAAMYITPRCWNDSLFAQILKVTLPPPSLILIMLFFFYSWNLEYPHVHPLYEVTSSGMTHSCETQIPFRHGCRFLLNMVMRSHWELTDFYEHLNWGTLEIDWDRAVVDLQIRDKEGAVALRHEVRLKSLPPCMFCLNSNPRYPSLTMMVIVRGENVWRRSHLLHGGGWGNWSTGYILAAPPCPL